LRTAYDQEVERLKAENSQLGADTSLSQAATQQLEESHRLALARVSELESQHAELQKSSAQQVQDLERHWAEQFQNSLTSQVAAERDKLQTAYQKQAIALQREFEDRTRAIALERDTEIARRSNEAAEVIERSALHKIEEQRQKALQEAQAELQAAQDKRLAGSTRRGALIADEKEGIALAASIRRGLDLNTIAPDVFARRVKSGVDGLVQDRYNRSLNDLAGPFADRAKAIRESKGSNKWQAMEHALIQQGNRERAVGVAVDDIRSKYQRQHEELINAFQQQAQGRGRYDGDLVNKVDGALTLLNRRMQKEMNDAIAQAIADHPLDQPFLGRKNRQTP
jgi:hypothetical protein